MRLPGACIRWYPVATTSPPGRSWSGRSSTSAISRRIRTRPPPARSCGCSASAASWPCRCCARGVRSGVSPCRVRESPFSQKQIDLLRTFADQAVIAIENVRLFTELQEKNRAVTEAHAQVTESLEQQTATGEILRVIASSPTDLQPVFDVMVQSAVRLCDGLLAAMFRFDGELIHFAAQHNFTPEGIEAVRRTFPVRPTRALGSGRAILRRAVVHIPDVEVDPEYAHQAMSARGRLSKRPLGTHDAGGRSHRRHRSGACRAGAVLRQPDRAAEDLRRPGGHRHRERAAVQRDEGGAGAADRPPPRSCG